MFESLESRRLLSITGFGTFPAPGVFAVGGTDGDDVIQISKMNNSTIAVSGDFAGVPFFQTVSAQSVQVFLILGYDGDDQVSIDGSLNIPSVQWLGDGDDTSFGGASLDWIVGGSGDDYMDGRGGDDFLFGDWDRTTEAYECVDVVYWNYHRRYDGQDILVGGTGRDLLDGGGNADNIYASDSQFDWIVKDNIDWVSRDAADQWVYW
jgi:Ca2+-binding RTX toxin-like protein